ncbi:hypothetical protein B0H10DRAFT_526134 [Mycena sp. CBHHK59/15]|nr:hypothetical protein B0H10DRAFT_526134 [Mycena sp. CBHHK59/15]
MDLARLVLTELAYMYEDPMKNRAELVAFDLAQFLPDLLLQVEPSPDLAHLVRAINPDFIFGGFNDPSLIASGVLSWLKIRSPPEDLVDLWEDYCFMGLLVSVPGHIDPSVCEPLSGDDCRQVLSQVVQCPLLPRLFHVWMVRSGNTKIRSLVLAEICALLDVSWDELRAAICRLRPIVGEDWEKWGGLFALMRNSTVIQRKSWRPTICIELARGCIRVRKLVDTGRLPEELWDDRIEWGRFIRGSSACPELLRDIRDFVPPPIMDDRYRLHQEIECHDVLQWLKSFPEPPLDAIHRWENFFCYERKKASERGVFYPPDDYDSRWREWEQIFPQ